MSWRAGSGVAATSLAGYTGAAVPLAEPGAGALRPGFDVAERVPAAPEAAVVLLLGSGDAVSWLAASAVVQSLHGEGGECQPHSES